MKKYLVSIFVSVVMLAGFSQAVNAQDRNYVKVRPSISLSLRDRPARPSSAHVWIGEDWAWRNGNYVHVGGHWDAPPAHRRTWVAGYWKNSPGHGHYWVAGRWR